MRSCPVCGEIGSLWHYHSGWYAGEDSQIDPVEGWCEFCGFSFQQHSTSSGADCDKAAKEYVKILKDKLDIDIIDEEIKYWTELKEKLPELEKRLKGEE